METVISFLQCIYLAVLDAFGKNTLYLWTYCSSITSGRFDMVFHWCYNNPNSIFIMKIIVTVGVGELKPNTLFHQFIYSWIRKNQTHHLDESGFKT